MEKKNNKTKIIIIVVSILVIIGIVIGSIVLLNSLKFSKELKYCYEEINNYNIENFAKKIDEHSTDEKFEEKAYNQLFKAIDEKIENIKNGQNDKDLQEMINNLIKDEKYSKIKEKLQSKLLLAQGYSILNNANEEIEQLNYEKAEQILLPYKDIGIQEITDLYNSIQNEIKQQKENKKAELLKKLDSKYDDMYATTYISPKGINSTSRKIHMAPYLAIDKNTKTLYIDLGFQEDDWIFFKQITFNIDGEITNISVKYNDIQRDTVWGDGIYEYIPLSQSKYANIFKLIENIINGNQVKIRFTGDQYYTDYVITEREKQGLKDIYELYKCY